MYSSLSQIFGVTHSNHRTIQSMEGLRGFAVFLVFLVHYNTLIEPLLPAATIEHHVSRVLRNVGNSGVDLFFVLSGYLIYGLLMRKSWQFKNYMIRRIQRIYPTFLVVFGFYLILSRLFPAENKIPEGMLSGGIYIIENLLFLPGLFDIEPMITVAWSLSYEFFYYIAVPLVITTTSMSSWRRSWRVLFFVTVSAAGFYYSALYGGHVRLLMFIAGILLYEAIESEATRVPRSTGLLALCGAFIAMPYLAGIGSNGAWRFVVLYVCFFLLCLDCFSSEGMSTKIFSWLPLRWYGNMSYSYYLIHGVALKAAFMLLASITSSPLWPGWFWLLILPMFMITLIPAMLLFAFVEKRFSLRSPAPHAAAVTGFIVSAKRPE